MEQKVDYNIKKLIKEKMFWIGLIAVMWAVFHLYTSSFGPLPAMKQRSIHLMFALILSFSLTSFFTKKQSQESRTLSYVGSFSNFILIGLSVITTLYIFIEFLNITHRLGKPNELDILFGLIIIVLVLEATRRKMGIILPIIAIIFIIYAFIGPYMSGALAHGGVSIDRFVTQLYLTTEGIFGIPLGVVATYVIIFIIFGAFLRHCGAGDFYVDFAYALFGKVRGGPAKVSIVSSSLFGTISGAVLANISTTGTFTIPLMKKTGYRPAYAAAIENAASTGSQITPPIMGAAVFIMAETLQIHYIEVVYVAAIPAFLYYVALFMMVDLQAGKMGIKGLPSSKLPHLWNTFKSGWYYFLPPIFLIYLLVGPNFSPGKSAFWSILVIIGLSWFTKNYKMTIPRIILSLKDGALGTLTVSMATACAGIIIGVLSATGLGTKLSIILIDLAQGSLFLLLLLTMLASLVLGMGITTTAAYIIVAVLVAPALIQVGINPIAAHLFVFYFAPLSNLTPPVAIGAYAAAGIAGASPMRTAVISTKLGFAGLLVPFLFIYHPVLLLDGTVGQIILAVFTAIVGIVSISIVMEQFLFTKLRWFENILFLVGGSLVLIPGMMGDVIGFTILVFIVLVHYLRYKKDKPIDISL